MVTHKLKAWPNSFNPIIDGTKRFDIRENDRDYHIGDKLLLEEFIPYNDVRHPTGEYTGRWARASVDYIWKGFPVPDNYVVMSITVLTHQESHKQN